MMKDMSASSNTSVKIFGSLFQALPCFAVKGDQVVILRNPEQFYDKLIEYSRNAKTRIKLASLYIGTGLKEQSLVNILEPTDSKEVKILLDGYRGSRGNINSRQLLISKCSSFFQVFLYHTPVMGSWLHKILPERYNEVIGLQHMKAYVFDNDVIISGANLSEDYFTNRQDRYVLIKGCSQLADFYSDLIDEVGGCSGFLNNDNTISYGKFGNFNISPFAEPKKYVEGFKDRILNFYRRYCTTEKNNLPGHDTWIYPLLEMPPFDIHYDSKTLKKILETAPEYSTMHLATGYFNLTKHYANIIINHSKAAFKFLIAHPMANGFFNASGLSGYIPSIYTALAMCFLQNIEQSGAASRISVEEYYKDGWTFHAKGLWFTPPGQDLPDMTIIGSSNFGDRSIYRDLETQLIIVTENNDLKFRLNEERKQLFHHGNQITNSTLHEQRRQPSDLVYYFTYFFRSFF